MNVPTAFPDQSKPVPPYKHTPLFPLGPDATPYKKISSDGARVEKILGKEMLVVSREALRALSEAAFGEINHYLRPQRLAGDHQHILTQDLLDPHPLGRDLLVGR